MSATPDELSRVLRMIEGGQLWTPQGLSMCTGLEYRRVMAALHKLMTDGAVECRSGLYRVTGEALASTEAR